MHVRSVAFPPDLLARLFTDRLTTKIVSFGYTPEESLLYGTPGGAVEVVALIFSGWLGDRLGQRILVSMGGLSLALLGMILIVALPLRNDSGRLAGYYLTQASPTPFVALLSLIATNVAGYTKKVSSLPKNATSTPEILLQLIHLLYQAPIH